MDVEVSTTGGNLHVTLYHYVPSGQAAWAFVTLFGLGTVVHFVYMFPLRAAYFIPLIVGGICETFGYYGRAWSHESPHNFKAYVLQNLLILVAPPFLAATIYMSLGRIIRSLDGEKYAIIRPRWLTKIFVLSDVICFITQMGGMDVVLGGLVFQVVVFGFFVFIAWKFHVRLRQGPTTVSRYPGPPWEKYMYAIYAASVAVLVRNIVRIFEYAQGSDGFVATHEAMVYIFDAFLMFFVILTFAAVHPGRLVRAANRFVEELPRGSMALIDSDTGTVPLTGYRNNSEH
ncbi:MAG: hypothetical protein M1834_008224 [Cirrosporium novae-zelandiae]|nr:MAG: hypothetical protein M1834_008224 [Cirrosporium novae-zelandiae]